MFNKKLVLSFGVFLIISCSKSSEVHFHGRISEECNDNPVVNATLSISRTYDNGSQQGETLGTVDTKNDGTYSLITDVDQEGTISYGFTIHVHATANYPEASWNFSSDEKYGSNIVNNKIVKSLKNYSFHVKNNSPISGNDKLNYLFIDEGNNYSFYDTLLINQTGTIDTTIHISNYQLKKIFYSFTKNGLTTLDSMEVHHSGCSDTLYLDVFY